jgi:hypothetical protein
MSLLSHQESGKEKVSRNNWGVIWGELSDCGRVGDGVERDREDGRGRHSRGRRLIGKVDR